ncbi:1-aminocyclopropane-1-carboxylate deaminase [Pedobacter cryoconitis]|uniref:1-aminocyclopropane-1-carboxylate deaminase n=1 Tax=Pedobacter cryoconitis TaxID=188932 RepID=A0A127VFT0_9SPHI|nr:pyridoxal-phosphate dependent enzyme [Pedobacter cryoconitis]AMQ00140.1 1-aminocyclopropane-1-carboxylate deaminase [Pedobacter cryoconitis]
MFTDLHSPLQQLKHSHLSGLWVKRDDLIDPYISGNKWRKLKYILKAAATENKNHLVTFGGAYSNHLVATASAAARSGLKATAFVRGEKVNNEMLVLCSLYGMELIFIDRETYKDKRACYLQYAAKHGDTYFIDEGGASAEAVLGCAEIIAELPKDIDHLFCAAGTGTTAAGLLQGIQKAGLKTKLHVIPVLKGGEFIRKEIGHYVATDDPRLVLHTDYHFGGYAKTKPELLDFIKVFTAEHGMLIDPVYTAKMFFAINDLGFKDYFAPQEKIVALHTGGLLGIMGMKDLF